MDSKEVLQQYIDQELMSGQQHIEVDEKLLSDGRVDSLGIMRLITFIEATFGIKVPPEDVTIENFHTINLIAEYIDSRQKKGPREKRRLR